MGLKDWLLRSGRNSGSADIAGCYADIQRWEDIYNGGGDCATPAGEAFRAAPESLLHWERPGRCAGNSPGCVSRRVLQCATPTAIPRAS